MRQITAAIVDHVKMEALVLKVEQTTTCAFVATDTSAVTAIQVCLHQRLLHFQIIIIEILLFRYIAVILNALEGLWLYSHLLAA